jgi:hypothetical protein
MLPRDDTRGRESNAVRRTGKNQCDLCGKRGSERNYLSLHHIDGNPKNNHASNKMVVHRFLCHTFADFITQWYKSHNGAATFKQIKVAWTTFNWKEAV